MLCMDCGTTTQNRGLRTSLRCGPCWQLSRRFKRDATTEEMKLRERWSRFRSQSGSDIDWPTFQELAKREVCDACGQRETYVLHGKVKALTFDHCHERRIVRGVLCHSCNIAVGYARNDPARLRALAVYLEK
jgi:Recombination endonuclease VII